MRAALIPSLVVILIVLVGGPSLRAACCYFSAQDKDVNQPGQKAFLTWDPVARSESFTVQPRFEGDARDFGMVIPTPSQPKLDEMPRDFFKHLALYTILLPIPQRILTPREWIEQQGNRRAPMAMYAEGISDKMSGKSRSRRDLGVRVLEAGVVGSLDYKIIEAKVPDGLFEWLKLNQYSYSGDEGTLKHYIDKKWFFTVMKIDTKQMKKNADGTYLGEITPTRFAFSSESLVYPLRITALSVKKNTEALFYVQAPQQMDLKETWSWLWSYRVMWLTSGTVCLSQKTMTQDERVELMERQQTLQRVRREIPEFDTTKLEWARRLTATDLAVLDDPVARWPQGGFPDIPQDVTPITPDELIREFEAQVAQLPQDNQESARSYVSGLGNQYALATGAIVRSAAAPGAVPGSEGTYHFLPHRTAPAPDVTALSQLRGHLKEGQFVTKFRKSFLKHEMKDDLELVPVEPKYGTEYLRILPQSPP